MKSTAAYTTNMPGRDYGQAYARLEEALRDSNFLRPYDTLAQHCPTPPSHDHRRVASTPSYPTLIPAAEFQSSRPSQELPPTPPLLTRIPLVSNVRPNTNGQPSAKRQNLSTPPNLTGLPTPDVTPPALRGYLSPPPVLEEARSDTNSPFAESFRTAREDWWSVGNASPLSLPVDEEAHSAPTVRAVAARKPSFQAPASDMQLSPFSPELAFDTTPRATPVEQARTFSSSSHSTPRASIDSSTRVGAVIIDNSPPPRSHKLRKVRRNVDLRSCSSPLPSALETAYSQPRQVSYEHKRELRRIGDQLHLREASQETPAEFAHLSPGNLDRHSPQTEKSAPRKSYDRSFRSHMGASPLSTRSGFSESLVEINDATAIQLYPRNNNSVVMVHRAERTMMLTDDAQLEIAPAAIGHAQDFWRQDSPLVNPRTAPAPPKLTVIPPSPVGTSSVETTPVDKVSGSRRRPSLLQRARANSAPIVDSLGSLKRTATGNLQRALSRRRRTQQQGYIAYDTGAESRSSQRLSSPESSSQGKHPFREPHPFWDEDVEQDAAGMSGTYANTAFDQRPATASAARDFGGEGGDEIAEESNWSRWKRGGSGRGFLIGNTLGIVRGPTNLRRPVFPAMKDMRSGARGRQLQSAEHGRSQQRSMSAPANEWERERQPKERRGNGGRSWWKAVRSGLKG